MPKKGLVILGSTGSIGRQTLDTVRAFPDSFEVVGLGAGNNISLLKRQIDEFQPKLVWSSNNRLSLNSFGDSQITPMDEMVCDPATDTVMVGTTGRAGLIPTLKALDAGKSVCLANKEVIIMAGEIISQMPKKIRTNLLPVDSEPSAIWQCLQGEDQPIRRLIITASGGPFRNTSEAELKTVTPEQALKHPTWTMGRRITIDSSTLMNKGFEVIEAHWLFEVDWHKIEVVVHPQSLIHSMVEFADGSVKAQLGPPDMRLPIQYSLFYPDRHANKDIPKLNIDVATNMTFEPMDPKRYPCFSLALHAGHQGATFPTVLCAADEVAVDLFLNREIRFDDIPKVVGQTLEDHQPGNPNNLEEVLASDEWARIRAREVAQK